MLAAFGVALLGVLIAFGELRAASAATFRGMISAGALVAVSGLIDDLKPAAPAKKLLVQVIAIALLQSSVDILGIQALAGAAPWIVGAAILASAFWIVGFSNSMNLVDGIDGLAAGITAISGVGWLSLAWAVDDAVMALCSAALVGAALGFLRSNAHPAKIFMGDTGSLFLGFVLASTAARFFWLRPEPLSLLAVVLIGWVPLVDAFYAILRRWRDRRSIFMPDRSHVHHRLLDAGLSHRIAGLILCGLSCVSAAAGVGVIQDRHPWTWAAAVLVATLPLAWTVVRRGAPPAAPLEERPDSAVSHNQAA